MKIIFHAQMNRGDATTQRVEALERKSDVTLVRSSFRPAKQGVARRIARKFAWHAGFPFDSMHENEQLLRLAREHRPDTVFVYNSRAIKRGTLRAIKRETGATLVFFSSDDAVAKHNVSKWLKQTFPLWDLYFTQKTFNVDELRARGVRRPVLTGNIFDPSIHKPMTPEEVGDEFESFDLVFVGTFEPEREASLRKLADAGFSVLVQGNAPGTLSGSWKRLREAGITVRPAAVHLDYTCAIHKGKVPLGFLRKLNRDQVTHRSIELPAMARAMLAEKTPEHDQHFIDGKEYIGFSSDEEMIEKARILVADAELRQSIGAAGRARCWASGYDVDTIMASMIDQIRDVANARPEMALR